MWVSRYIQVLASNATPDYRAVNGNDFFCDTLGQPTHRCLL